MIKFLFTTFLSLFTTLGFAAGSRISSAQVAPQLSVAGNYFVNPICLKNDYNVTDADSIASCTTGLSDAGTAWRIDADASGEKAVWTWTAYPERLEGGNCVVGGTYTGDFSNYEVNVIQNSVTLVTANATGSDFPNVTGKQPFEVSFLCGSDNANLVTVEIEATDAGAGQLDLIWEQGGENTNIGSAAQAEVLVRASGTPTGGLNGTTATVWGTEDKDVNGIYNNSTGIITAKEAGEYCWKAGVKVDGTESLDNFLALAPEKNGTQVPGEYFIRLPGAVSSIPVQSNGCVDLSTGDTLEFVTNTNISSASFLSGEENYITITRIPTASEQVKKYGFPGQELTSYTPSFTNVTAASSTFHYQCDAGKVYISGVVTSTAAGAGSELRIGLPTGFTTDTGATKIVGPAGRSSNAAASYLVLAEDGVDYLTFSAQASGNGALTKLTGAQVFDAAVSFSFTALVPVDVNSPCPRTSTGLFKNGVTTSSEGVERIERIIFSGATPPSNCTGTCTKEAGTPAMSVVRANTGDYNVTISPEYSEKPSCDCTANNIGAGGTNTQCNAMASSGSNVNVLVYRMDTNALADSYVSVKCTGGN